MVQFVVLQLLVVILLIRFPDLVTWLPRPDAENRVLRTLEPGHRHHASTTEAMFAVCSGGNHDVDIPHMTHYLGPPGLFRPAPAEVKHRRISNDNDTNPSNRPARRFRPRDAVCAAGRACSGPKSLRILHPDGGPVIQSLLSSTRAFLQADWHDVRGTAQGGSAAGRRSRQSVPDLGRRQQRRGESRLCVGQLLVG